MGVKVGEVGGELVFDEAVKPLIGEVVLAHCQIFDEGVV